MCYDGWHSPTLVGPAVGQGAVQQRRGLVDAACAVMLSPANGRTVPPAAGGQKRGSRHTDASLMGATGEGGWVPPSPDSPPCTTATCSNFNAPSPHAALHSAHHTFMLTFPSSAKRPQSPPDICQAVAARPPNPRRVCQVGSNTLAHRCKQPAVVVFACDSGEHPRALPRHETPEPIHRHPTPARRCRA